MLFTQAFLPDPKILIVDDEAINVLLLKQTLDDLGQIYTASSGIEALELAVEHIPDIVVLDIDMPKMNGLEVCQSLKSDPLTQHISVIFVTAFEGSKIESAALAIGGVDFISKPYNLSTCRLRVRNQLMIQQYSKSVRVARDDLETLVRQVPVYIAYWDDNWVNLFNNDFEGEWFGQVASLSQSKSVHEVFPMALADKLQRMSQNEFPDYPVNFDFTYTKCAGGLVHVHVSLSKSCEVDKHGYLVTIADITQIKQAEAKLHDEKERLKVTLNSIGDGVIATDTRGIVTFINPIAERMTGWQVKDAIGKLIEDVMFLSIDGSLEPTINPIRIALKEERIVGMALNCKLVSVAGEQFHVEDSAAPIRDNSGVISGAIIVFHDVSETVAMSIKMSHLANHDQLTDLPNRVLVHDRLTYGCRLAHFSGKRAATLLIDIDHFKYLNESLGHNVGDEVIRGIANRITSIIPETHTLARVGGDEFLLLMPNVNDTREVDVMAARLTHLMHEPFIVSGNSLNVSVSIGISIYPDDAKDQDQLMRHADAALFRAKQEGRNRYCFFSDELEQKILQRHSLERTLREALDGRGIEVFYQPKIHFASGKPIGFEALARLRSEDGNIISPAEFIPLAEETGLINILGRQVLETACSNVAEWRKKFGSVRVSVNVSAIQFAQSDFISQVLEALSKAKLDSEALELEVTETGLMVDDDAAEFVLQQLHSHGVSVSIDDFGTGYSSLSYLKKFKVNVLKIDQSFVRDMLIDRSDMGIVKTIISLAHSLCLSTVAEGIEEQAHLKALMDMGCEVGQGYWFSRPIPANEVTGYLSGFCG